VLAAVEDLVDSELIGEVQPKGFSRITRVHDVTALQPREVST
jgi:hypothetical protein